MAKLRCMGPRLATIDSRRVRPPPKSVDPHYQTPEHRAWSKAVIERAGGRCQDAGHDPRRPRGGVRLFADHIHELRDGGAPFDLGNGAARCGACHSRITAARRARRLAAR